MNVLEVWTRSCNTAVVRVSAAGGGAVGGKKQGAKGEGGLQGERLSLVHRYMGEAATDARATPPADGSGDSDTTPQVLQGRLRRRRGQARPVEADAPPAEPEEAQTSRRSQQSGSPPASHVRHEAHLPIYAWTRADVREGEQQRDSDWPHELVRLREERDRAQTKLP
jgi:hypothetical protein